LAGCAAFFVSRPSQGFSGGIMNQKLFFLLSILSVSSLLNSVIWEIKQDGTGDFISIQEGINASADTDTVLVYPGTYYENINFNGKNITVASLYLTTGNDQYINQTIINGNQTGSCVRIMSEEDETTLLCGFTLTNGSGSPWYEDGPDYGGGLLLIDTQSIIENCLIKNNNAESGGGIYCMSSQIILAGVDIINNHAYYAGGGIFSRTDSEIEFDQNELCNIYLNYSGLGCEIIKAWSCPPMEVYVDTFTVFEPDGYFICSATSTGIPLNDVILNMQNAKLEPANTDLYVSTEGDNNNSGLTPNEPLKNINFALSLVKSDTLHPNTIHIADGTYSQTMNNDCFPLNMRGYVSLEGESMENVIFNAEDNSPHIYDNHSKLDYLLKNITLLNGTGHTVSSILISVYQQFDKFVNFENIKITDCFSYTKNMKLFYMDLSIKNIHSYSNDCTLLWALNSYQSEQEVIIENAYIHDNHQYDSTSMSSDAGPQLSFGMLGTEPMNVTITNMELTENIQTQSDWPESSSGVSVGDNVNLNLINCTIGNNSSPGNGGAINFFPGQNSVINIYNSIFYGDNPGEIYIDNEFSSNPSTLNINNSLVYGGEYGIGNPYSWNVINWNEGNLSAFADPLWQNSGEFSYSLTSGSPCIDSGTLDLPPGIELPEYDLAGNPRIYGDTIDMGAYEWQGTGISNIQLPMTNTQITNYPNPFNPSTTIKLDLTEPGKIELAIYNIKGQKVKTLMDAYSTKGHFEITWNCKDDYGKSVSSGQYFVKLKQNGEELIASKMLLLK
jgi:hypothetical protein